MSSSVSRADRMSLCSAWLTSAPSGFRHGDKSFRVTSWYASRFANLRSSCGLTEDLYVTALLSLRSPADSPAPSLLSFVESLSRCNDLNPSGGKSSAAFWTTLDRRFLLKELVRSLEVLEVSSALTPLLLRSHRSRHGESRSVMPSSTLRLIYLITSPTPSGLLSSPRFTAFTRSK